MEDQIIKDLRNPFIQGLSLSGGHPLHVKNLPEVLNLCRRVKEELPNKDIWLWTGLTINQIKEDLNRKAILEVVDIVVDGKYEAGKTTNKLFRGSDNQFRYRIENGDITFLD
ncbi:4Fe-4S single cluster domain protein [Vibrio phage 1.063.O._10N.261.45.C7]|nr:4Fe-4S single cluster domain protein [Vibrio phage 1.063.O._10N.261.45.C7]